MNKVNDMATIRTLRYLHSLRNEDSEVLFDKTKMFGACLNLLGKERYGVKRICLLLY